MSDLLCGPDIECGAANFRDVGPNFTVDSAAYMKERKSQDGEERRFWRNNVQPMHRKTPRFVLAHLGEGAKQSAQYLFSGFCNMVLRIALCILSSAGSLRAFDIFAVGENRLRSAQRENVMSELTAMPESAVRDVLR